MRGLALRLTALALGIAVPLLMAEIALRFLPVSTGLRTQQVDEAQPVFRFTSDRAYVWSRDWNFTMTNKGWVNNSGFVNDQNYATDGARPLLAVIGDSYVEAAMVPYGQTFHGLLASRVAGRGRVYSFGASGAPLSQYLAWIAHARQEYGADAMVVTIIGNDFDESLASVGVGPGFHHYVEEDGQLVLRRFDYRPGPLRDVVGSSALARYLLFHLKADVHARRLLHSVIPAAHAGEAQYVGNVAVDAGADRIAQSKWAVAAFFRDLPAHAGLPPERIAFVVDGLRYPHSDSAGTSYFAIMRRHFIAEARRRGYQAVDMDEYFFSHLKQAPDARFEWPMDGHWNALGHALAARAVAEAPMFRTLFPHVGP